MTQFSMVLVMAVLVLLCVRSTITLSGVEFTRQIAKKKGKLSQVVNELTQLQGIAYIHIAVALLIAIGVHLAN